ncbi:MAG: ABC transporter ATP-binding protein [Clostridiales bacterium]|jgi:ABC-2 type transport system ATP-binding protein|nr:ABC transporter ATP-binding protein [Clostridiales bacterium]
MLILSESFIKLRNVQKSYAKKRVLTGIDFELYKGQIVGLFGPNGCGKTTLLKIIAGLIHDYEGSLSIDGHSPSSETKQLTAFLPDKMFLFDWMTAGQAISYFADFYRDFNTDKAKELLQKFSLSEKEKIKNMSKGMQEKLMLSLVMSRSAKLFLLDEPLGGVDPASREAILNFIMENHSEDSIILMATHLINDLERMFERVIFIGDGKVLVDDSVENIKSRGISVEDAFKEVFRNAW